MKNFIFRLFAIVMIVAVCNCLKAQERIAVVDFKAGAGVSQGDIDGVSSIFTTYFTDTDLFTMVERSQIDRIILEQGFQMTDLTNDDAVRIGQLLNLQKIVIGDITIVSGQYNVDVRVIDVESGAVCAANGATWERGSSYRELMRDLANKLKETLKNNKSETINVAATQESPKVVTILGYLHVYPEDLGIFESVPNTVIAAVNKNIMYGYNDWRLPNNEEMSLIKGNISQINGIVTNVPYMTSDRPSNGRVRLVTTGESYEAKQRAEQIAREQQEQARKEQEAREAALKQAFAKLTETNKIRYIALTKLGMDIKYIPKIKMYEGSINIVGANVILNHGENPLEKSGWEVANYKELAKIPEFKSFLQSCKFWYTNEFRSSYEGPTITVDGEEYCCLTRSNMCLYNSESNDITFEVILHVTRQELNYGEVRPRYVMFFNECSISAIYVKRLTNEEAKKSAEEIILPYIYESINEMQK